VLPFVEKIILAFVCLGTAVLFLTPLVRRARIVLAGRPAALGPGPASRLRRALSQVLLQRCTVRAERPVTGVMHALLFYGALTFDIMTVNHTAEGFLAGFSLFGHGAFGRLIAAWTDLCAIFVMAGVVFLAFRRFVLRPKAYATTPADSARIYLLITLATATYLAYEVFAAAAHPAAGAPAFLGSWLAAATGAARLDAASAAAGYHTAWWAHIVAVYGFIIYVPHSKYLHMFAGPLNVFFRRAEPSGALTPLDLETSEVFGLEKTPDLSWKDNLDAFACMECGRCQDACPAFASDKPLSPKMILFNQERALLRDGPRAGAAKRETLPPLVPDSWSEGEVWTCTTCGACMNVCPVEIGHIPKLIGARQSRVLMESKFPAELNSVFRNLETNSNPWGLGFAKRGEWTEGLEVPLFGASPGAEYLLWVGCFGAYDEGGRKIARAMVRILKTAGVPFGVLGTEEKCCGDSARRLGNEYLFQSLARENLETFLKRGVRKIVTICPHGMNAFKHEYPALVDLLKIGSPAERDALRAVEVVSHVELIDALIRNGRLVLRPRAAASYTVHDSCYLARHNAIVREPRSALAAALSGRRIELGNAKEHGFCCGAGGGLMWTEESLGRRINHLRADEIIATGAGLAASACPLCLTMLRDGLKDKDRADIRVADVAEIVAEALEP
jgi:Fe-S oxidoreductase